MDTLFPMLLRAEGGRCYLCPERLHDRACRRGGITKEHVVPRAKQGGVRRNILLAHRLCNLRKGDRMPHPCELIYLDAIYTNLGMP